MKDLPSSLSICILKYHPETQRLLLRPASVAKMSMTSNKSSAQYCTDHGIPEHCTVRYKSWHSRGLLTCLMALFPALLHLLKGGREGGRHCRHENQTPRCGRARWERFPEEMAKTQEVPTCYSLDMKSTLKAHVLKVWLPIWGTREVRELVKSESQMMKMGLLRARLWRGYDSSLLFPDLLSCHELARPSLPHTADIMFYDTTSQSNEATWPGIGRSETMS